MQGKEVAISSLVASPRAGRTAATKEKGLIQDTRSETKTPVKPKVSSAGKDSVGKDASPPTPRRLFPKGTR